MKINWFLIQFAIMIIVIFGGVLTLRYFRAGELLIDQLIGAVVGVVLLVSALIWRKGNN